jgi:ATP-dependent DNA ligase
MLTKDLSTSKRVQPCFIEPMQVAGVRELPDGGLWTYEAKLDGYRCLAASSVVRRLFSFSVTH